MNKQIILSAILLALVAATVIVASPTVLAKKSKDLGGPAGGYDTGFAVGVERANEAVDQFDNEQIKSIDADNHHHVLQMTMAMDTA
jgi:hypothetical protein